jgi:tetratricopeptide (TPR) repeat protein
LTPYKNNDISTTVKYIADVLKALRLDPYWDIGYMRRAGTYFDMGDYDRAIADFEAALRIDPNNIENKNNLERARRRGR